MRLARRSSATAVAVGIAAIVACSGPEPETADPCGDLALLQLIDMRITSAEQMPAGDAEPAHCRVTGVIETEINFELLLPEEWNGRFMMGGGGGYVGTVQNQAQSLYSEGGTALERGYATVGTDTGHTGTGTEAGWALNNPQRRENFGHRAVHLTAEAAKSIISHYYDRPPDYSYFLGCSRGGGQAMMESQRYPDDFDGLVAGAPAYYWTAFTAGFVQTQQAVYPSGNLSTPVVTSQNRQLLAAGIDAACDELDGVDDGILNEPRACGFRPESLPRCADEEAAADCVTSAQLAAIQAVYDGPTSNGEPLFVGFPLGGENDPGGWDRWITDASDSATLHHAFGTELYKHFVFDDPDWDYTTYDFSTWQKDTASTGAILDAIDTDLTALRNAGGKIIFWTGWSDAALTALGTIAYYEEAETRDPDVREFGRLYMMPGVLHCGGGPGPDRVDWIEAIRAWVEDGQAPRRLVAATRDDSGVTTMSRPLCPYPEVAVYDGEGSPDTEGSFSCSIPR